MFAIIPEFSSWAAWNFRPLHWLAWGAMVLVLTHGGACLPRWADHYAQRLELGAIPDAATLWGAAGVAWRRRRLAWPDRVCAALWGGGAGAATAFWGASALEPLGLCLTLMSLGWIDARSGLLPDAITLPLMVAGWLCGPLPLEAASSASALVWAGLAAAAGGYRWLRGQDGFGAGDVKCLAALAAWLGVPATMSVLWQACVVGLVAWAWQRCFGRGGRSRSGGPFGPCIAAAAMPAISGVPALQSWF